MKTDNFLLILLSSLSTIGALAVSLPNRDLSPLVGLKGGSIASTAVEKAASNGTSYSNSGANNATSTAFSFAMPPGPAATTLDVPEDTDFRSEELSLSVEEQLRHSLSQHQEMMEENGEKKRALKVLFLSADTGGGHRASAESLANQFQKHYPGTTYDLLDVWTPTNIYPYKTLVQSYKHLSAHPRQWKMLYYISNTRAYDLMTNIHSTAKCKEKIREQMEKYDPDVVVSVHPTMNYLPEKITREIAKVRGKDVPFFTVVTDFGSGHCTWFQKDVDKMYIASDKIEKLAKKRGHVSDEQLVMSGLPIRDAFGVEADKMVDRTMTKGKEYRRQMKVRLGLDPEKRVVLAMGGGEGVGSLSKITEKLHLEMKAKGVDATILVVCGRNANLREELNSKDWQSVPMPREKVKNLLGKLGKKKDSPQLESDPKLGNVDVVGLGFVNNMAEYMVAADVLVSKAGPGTIAEAASLGLPVMITSFLPGQEAGNVDIVLDGEFGAFCKKPPKIAQIVTSWLQDDAKLDELSRNSAKVGNPHAASNIALDIGRITLETMDNNYRKCT